MERGEFSEKADTKVHDDKYWERTDKEARIVDACERWDIQELQALAQSPGGFLTDELRQDACQLP